MGTPELVGSRFTPKPSSTVYLGCPRGPRNGSTKGQQRKQRGRDRAQRYTGRGRAPDTLPLDTSRALTASCCGRMRSNRGSPERHLTAARKRLDSRRADIACTTGRTKSHHTLSVLATIPQASAFGSAAGGAEPPLLKHAEPRGYCHRRFTRKSGPNPSGCARCWETAWPRTSCSGSSFPSYGSLNQTLGQLTHGRQGACNICSDTRRRQSGN